jgi:hypothetical protein
MKNIFLVLFVQFVLILTSNAQIVKEGIVIKTTPFSILNTDHHFGCSVEHFFKNNFSGQLNSSYIFETNSYDKYQNYNYLDRGFIAGLSVRKYLSGSFFVSIGGQYKYLKSDGKELVNYGNNFSNIQDYEFTKRRQTVYGSLGAQFTWSKITYEFEIGLGPAYKQYKENGIKVDEVKKVHDVNFFKVESKSGSLTYFFLTHRFGFHLRSLKK